MPPRVCVHGPVNAVLVRALDPPPDDPVLARHGDESVERTGGVLGELRLDEVAHDHELVGLDPDVQIFAELKPHEDGFDFRVRDVPNVQRLNVDVTVDEGAGEVLAVDAGSVRTESMHGYAFVILRVREEAMEETELTRRVQETISHL